MADGYRMRIGTQAKKRKSFGLKFRPSRTLAWTPFMIVDNKSHGIFQSRSWIVEGDGLNLSSRHLRSALIENRKRISTNIDQPYKIDLETIASISALSRSSMLLLGYAAEMYLKCGIVKLYQYCPTDTTNSELRRFGHHLKNIASRIGFPMSREDEEGLDTLQRCISEDARYPVTPKNPADYFSKTNRLSIANSNEKNYDLLSLLSGRIRNFVSLLNNNPSDPLLIWHHASTEGYIVARRGGGIKPTIIFKNEGIETFDQLLKGLEHISRIAAQWHDYEIWQEANEGKRILKKNTVIMAEQAARRRT